MARIGSVAAAPFVGGQFVSLYLGDTRVPTVPGKPADPFVFSGATSTVQHPPVSANGGSAVTSYLYFIDGTQTTPDQTGTFGPFLSAQFNQNLAGKAVTIAAVNAIGAGPKSNPVTAN
jgi:hypothetical protein